MNAHLQSIDCKQVGIVTDSHGSINVRLAFAGGGRERRGSNNTRVKTHRTISLKFAAPQVLSVAQVQAACAHALHHTHINNDGNCAHRPPIATIQNPLGSLIAWHVGNAKAYVTTTPKQKRKKESASEMRAQRAARLGLQGGGTGQQHHPMLDIGVDPTYHHYHPPLLPSTGDLCGLSCLAELSGGETGLLLESLQAALNIDENKQRLMGGGSVMDWAKRLLKRVQNQSASAFGAVSAALSGIPVIGTAFRVLKLGGEKIWYVVKQLLVMLFRQVYGVLELLTKALEWLGSRTADAVTALFEKLKQALIQWVAGSTGTSVDNAGRAVGAVDAYLEAAKRHWTASGGDMKRFCEHLQGAAQTQALTVIAPTVGEAKTGLHALLGLLVISLAGYSLGFLGMVPLVLVSVMLGAYQLFKRFSTPSTPWSAWFQAGLKASPPWFNSVLPAAIASATSAPPSSVSVSGPSSVVPKPVPVQAAIAIAAPLSSTTVVPQPLPGIPDWWSQLEKRAGSLSLPTQVFVPPQQIASPVITPSSSTSDITAFSPASDEFVISPQEDLGSPAARRHEYVDKDPYAELEARAKHEGIEEPSDVESFDVLEATPQVEEEEKEDGAVKATSFADFDAINSEEFGVEPDEQSEREEQQRTKTPKSRSTNKMHKKKRHSDGSRR